MVSSNMTTIVCSGWADKSIASRNFLVWSRISLVAFFGEIIRGHRKGHLS